MIEPIHKSITVNRPVAEVFELFTAGINGWWPVATHACNPGRVKEAVMETRQGGEVYEILDDGERVPWGKILTWDPPRRFVMTWHPGRDPETAQEVDVRFSDINGSTVVELTHSGWERYGDNAAEMRGKYAEGWGFVLEKSFVEACTG
ncbi:MAG: SRPBCC domain-containing protein [Acidobacteriota bacterium]|nr:SRPBCC domain-containing protein [Acidobacteriota bacterium]